MPSTMRPELKPGDGSAPCVSNGTAYLMTLTAVEQQDMLIHGRLHQSGAHCAIGSFFTVNKNVSVPWEFVDEVAAVNDSVPHLSGKQRKLHVMRWLKWKLASLGMPGFAIAAKRHGRRTR